MRTDVTEKNRLKSVEMTRKTKSVNLPLSGKGVNVHCIVKSFCSATENNECPHTIQMKREVVIDVECYLHSFEGSNCFRKTEQVTFVLGA